VPEVPVPPPVAPAPLLPEGAALTLSAALLSLLPALHILEHLGYFIGQCA